MHHDERTRVPAGDNLGFHHVAFSVGSKQAADAKTEQLRAAGFDVVSGPRTTGDGYYEAGVVDLFCNRIEVAT